MQHWRIACGCRSIFLKFDVEGYNHEEIAGIFGCSVGNSKSQLHKARRKLRKLSETKIKQALPGYPKLFLSYSLCKATVFKTCARPAT